jgi:hypothetical protein
MTLRQARRQRPRNASLSHHTPIRRVIPFLEWCGLSGISESTGRRLVRAGKVKITDLSPRRIGVREDHDQEYLDSCVRGRHAININNK